MTLLRHIAAALIGAGLGACSVMPAGAPTSTPSAAAIVTSTIEVTPTPTPTPTPHGCLSAPGVLERHELENGTPVQEMLVYLPPCYDIEIERHYPVLYLLHGQTYQDDQWVNLGATVAADNLIHGGQAPAFIMVFPDDRHWNLPPGETFGDRLINEILPYVDRNFRTLPDRKHRALGGLSRGGGWAIRYALTRHELFGTVGLHSPVIFNEDAAILERLIPAVPGDEWPRLWLDAGDRDGDLGSIVRFEALLTMYEVPHEWHVYAGDHTNPYWQVHLTQYLEWYADGFTQPGSPEIKSTPMP